MGPDVRNAAGGRPDGPSDPARLLHQGLHLAAVWPLGEIEGDGVRPGGQQKPKAQINSRPSAALNRKFQRSPRPGPKTATPRPATVPVAAAVLFLHLSCTLHAAEGPDQVLPAVEDPGMGRSASSSSWVGSAEPNMMANTGTSAPTACSRPGSRKNSRQTPRPSAG